MEKSAGLCRQFGFARIEVPVFFMGIQQCERTSLGCFLLALGLEPNVIYQEVAKSLNRLEKAQGGGGSIPVSASLVNAFSVCEAIKGEIECLDKLYPLYAALIMVPGPVHEVFGIRGVDTAALQRVLESNHLRVANVPDVRYGVDDTSPVGQPGNAPAPSEASSGPSRTQPSMHTPSQPSGPTTSQSSGRTAQQPSQQPRRPARPDCPAIRHNCIDLMEKAERGEIKPVIGRDREIERVLQILSLYTKNNPVLVGDPGTGKTAIVEGLAVKLVRGEVFADLADLYIYQLDPTSIEAEDVMRKIIEEAKANPQVVLFIDEIHTLISKCSCSDNSFANLLKPEMARGTVKIMGATTLDEYAQNIEKDKAFERRFQKVIVDEPSVEDAIAIISGIKDRFEQHHRVSISQEAVESAVRLGVRYIPDRRLPDKAIDLLDEASSDVRLSGGSEVTGNDIRTVITRRTGIPVENLTAGDMMQLKNIEEHLHRSVVGQDKAIKAVADSIRRSRMGLSDAARPVGSFLFLGTSGVGKTELCKALAEYLFQSRDAMVRIDMSEYQLEHSVSRLFGAPPGYVGYEQGGQLTEAVRRKPFSIVLFDEMEKANPKVFETILQVLDDGRMTDGIGRTVDFRNTIIVMTSNMGQDVIARNLAGGSPSEEDISRTTSEVLALLRRRAAPEFWGRIDKVVMFLPLSQDEVLRITEMQLESARKRMAAGGITVEFGGGVAEHIALSSYKPEYGAREIKKAVNTMIIDNVVSSLADGSINKDAPVVCSVAGGSIICSNR
ncbi:MAG: AAA family ATPase [Candidatus Cryptobacteroides sp.]